MEEAGLGASDVDFVLGHGNGVQASDISELNYMKRVFGRRTRDVPLISTKPIYGHTLGASSALNAATAALMLHHDFVVPTVKLDQKRVVHGFNHQANQGESRPLRSGFVVAYGIGGAECDLVAAKGRRMSGNARRGLGYVSEGRCRKPCLPERAGRQRRVPATLPLLTELEPGRLGA